MEIGSFFEINPASVAEKSGAAEPARIRAFGKKNCAFTASGREAIALVLEHAARTRPRLPHTCLLPAYMCDSVFLPFVRAGWEIRFYHVGKELEADREKLAKQLEETGPCLLFVHPYYGVDTWAAVRPFFAEWKEKGICIMEDVTQSYYLKSAGKGADYVVGSLRKWYPVPDGGFAAADEALFAEECKDRSFFVRNRMELQQEKWSYLHECRTEEEKRALKAHFLRKNREMEDWLDRCEGIGGLSEVSSFILRQADEEACRKKRNENYRALYQSASGKTQLAPILPFEEEAAPLYLAVYAKNREKLQKFLGERQIYAPVLWPVGRENEGCLTEEERFIFDHMLALPMDQRYGAVHMSRIGEVLEAYEGAEAERIGIRADANETVASGHIMRCITIAKRLREKGARPVFFTADEGARDFLERAGMEYVCLHTDWADLEAEADILCGRLREHGCKKLLVDSYQVTKGYLEKLREVCRLIYIDDCFADVYPADMLINYNAYHVRFPYREAYAGRTRLLLGTAFVPLREEFGKKRDSGKDPDALHVLLCVGGGDRHHAMKGILEEFFSNDGKSGAAVLEREEPCAGEKRDKMAGRVIFHAVAGRFCEDAQALERLAGAHPDIRVHYDVTDMAGLMAQCAAAVSAAGTMLFELSAMQVPTVFFVSVDNQQYDQEYFAAEDRMRFAGDIRADRQQCLCRIGKELGALLADEELRRKMREKLREVTDGRGAERIAQEILRL